MMNQILENVSFCEPSETQMKMIKSWFTKPLLEYLGEEEKGDCYIANLLPRRFGKSAAIAMFLASMSIVVPKYKVCVYTCSKRHARVMKQYIREYQQLMCEKMKLKIEMRKVDSMVFSQSDNDCVNTDMMIVDEFCYFTSIFLYHVIVPWMMIDKTSLICVGSPIDFEHPFMDAIMNAKSNNKLVFTTTQYQTICSECLKKLKDSGEELPSACEHGEFPKFRNIEKMNVAHSIMQQNLEKLKKELDKVKSETKEK